MSFSGYSKTRLKNLTIPYSIHRLQALLILTLVCKVRGLLTGQGTKDWAKIPGELFRLFLNLSRAPYSSLLYA